MKNLRICLVDDDRDDIEVFQDAFNELNLENMLQTFRNGQEVIEYLHSAEEVPDIIFLDLNMPIMGGLEALMEIRKKSRYKLLSVAIYSTSASERDIEKTLAAGANIYIKKPTNFQVLKDTIARVLKVNWQYHNSELDKETFVFVI